MEKKEVKKLPENPIQNPKELRAKLTGQAPVQSQPEIPMTPPDWAKNFPPIINPNTTHPYGYPMGMIEIDPLKMMENEYNRLQAEQLKRMQLKAYQRQIKMMKRKLSPFSRLYKLLGMLKDY